MVTFRLYVNDNWAIPSMVGRCKKPEYSHESQKSSVSARGRGESLAFPDGSFEAVSEFENAASRAPSRFGDQGLGEGGLRHVCRSLLLGRSMQ